MKLTWPIFITNTTAESLKFFFIRITIAALIIYRELINFQFTNHFSTPDAFLGPGFFAVLGLALLLGIFTKGCYLVLLLFYIKYNVTYGIMNLAPLFLQVLFFLGFILDNNPIYSFDSYLSKKFPKHTKYLNLGFKAPTMESFNFWYGAAFLIYGANSLAAVAYHLQDLYWTSGKTVQAMLVNNFLSRYFIEFRAIEIKFPTLMQLFSSTSVIAQTTFQLLMIPLIFNRWGRWFVIIHGFIFFTISLIFLQISLLPIVEIILWLCLFGNQLANIRINLNPYKITITKVQTAALSALLAISIIESIAPLLKNRAPIHRTLTPYFMYLGIWPPNVFNKEDLKMGETWFVITRQSPTTSSAEEVPFFASDGGRMNYHSSDFIYYAQTLSWRRASVNADWQKDEPAMTLVNKIKDLCKFDYKYNHLTVPTDYTIHIYTDNSMNMSIPLEERYKRKLLKKETLQLSQETVF